MFLKELLRHRAELNRVLANTRYERTESGLRVPSMKLELNGVFRHRVNDGPEAIDANLFLNGGLDDVLKVYFAQSAQRTAFYVVCFTNDIEVSPTLTAADFVSTMGEFTGYSETTRPVWAKGAEAAQAIGNGGTPAVFSANAAATVRGAALTTASAKSSTTGTMPTCSRFSVDRALAGPPDKLSIEYDISAVDGSA